MQENGFIDAKNTAAVGACARYEANKISRGQLGVGLHETWIRDIAKSCGTKALYICDFAHGVGEVARAAVTSKASVEATDAGVRICYWGHDPRKIFSEMGSAIARSELSRLFAANKLIVPGHQPVADPGPKPEKSRRMLKALLPQPLKILSLAADGSLLIPTQDEMKQACPVALNEEQLQRFESWRQEFPRPLDSAPASATEPLPQPPSAGDPHNNNTPGAVQEAAPAPGTIIADEASMKERFGESVSLDKQPLPGGNATTATKVKLVLVQWKDAGGNSRSAVMLHNSSDKALSLPVGTFVGKGGMGKLQSIVDGAVDQAKMPFAWRYTRLTGYKQDKADAANGAMVFNKTGAPLGLTKPKLSCLADIESELGNAVSLYGHAITRGGNKVTITPSPTPICWVPTGPAVGGDSGRPAPPAEPFGPLTLGQYLRSNEESNAAPKCMGYVRPVFEVRPQQTPPPVQPGAPAYNVQPGAPPGNSMLWLFLCKRTEMIPGGGFLSLG